VLIVLKVDYVSRKKNIGEPMIRRYDDRQWQLVFISGLADALLFMHLAATSPGLGGQ
jgi:hypothetical protein